MRWEDLEFSVGGAACRLVAVEAQYRPRETYNRHRHAYMEIHYVTAGRCAFRVGADDVRLAAGELLAIGAETYHSVKAAPPDLSKMSLGLELTPGGTEEGRQLLARLRQPGFLRLPAAEQDALFRLLRTAGAEALRQPLLREEVKARLALFVLYLARHAPPRARETRPAVPAAPRHAEQIEEFFNLNYRLPNGKAVLARRLSVSQRQLDRILHALYGMGFREKRGEIRTEIARDMLLTTDRSIEDIAAFLGYGSASNFTAFFKKSTGQPPSALRRPRG